MFQHLFSDLGLSENANRVFNELLQKGPRSARQLSENLAIPRPSTYDAAKALIQKGLIIERFEDSKKIFQIDDIRNLPQLIKNKIDSLEKERQALEEELPNLTKKLAFIEPKIKFYSGTEGVRQVLNQMLWYKNIETICMWPISEMVSLLGKDYFIELNKRRLHQGISVRTIWPQDRTVNFKDHPFLGIGGGHLRSLRLAPKGMTWDMGYWMYEDRVAFISSRKEAFGYVIHSKDFADLLRSQFEVIWKISKPIKPQPKYTDEFLKKLNL